MAPGGDSSHALVERLRRAAREIFEEALAESDARRAVLGAIRLEGARLSVLGTHFDTQGQLTRVYSVALGKAGRAMAAALDEALGPRLMCGVVSAPPKGPALSDRWAVYEGGHPLPDAQSLEAARAAFELLREADGERALVIFLVSGGGSAMMECARDRGVTLEDLREANRLLVSCGASIAEVNRVRRALSAVKGGGLSAAAPRASQVTLIVSDVNRGRESDVASGPTFAAQEDDEQGARRVVKKYKLTDRLPPSVLRALEQASPPRAGEAARGQTRLHHVLLDNAGAVGAAAAAARSRGFAVEAAADLVEQDVAGGAGALVSRVAGLYGRAGGRPVCLVSGGEFACPVRGEGVGGRSGETALRCAFEFEKLAGVPGAPRHLVALAAGTDGVDGNSPAAGALADEMTVARALALGLDPRRHLEESDAYTLFERLGDAVLTGPTGTNVRDLRLLFAG